MAEANISVVQIRDFGWQQRVWKMKKEEEEEEKEEWGRGREDCKPQGCWGFGVVGVEREI